MGRQQDKKNESAISVRVGSRKIILKAEREVNVLYVKNIICTDNFFAENYYKDFCL